MTRNKEQRVSSKPRPKLPGPSQPGLQSSLESIPLARSHAAYTGAPWRSRFLRAPKIALALGQRTDFVSLSELAEIKLGLKTGADKFFFVDRKIEKPSSRRQDLLSSRGAIEVIGMNQWYGEIAKSDLLPAIVNPHEFFEGEIRRFKVKPATEKLYLYPTPTAPRYGLKAYIRLAELASVNEKDLVRSNAGSSWYRQSRAIVTSPWALPYNSAYDYGAWDNAVGAVLNGRFVGVSPKDTIDSELLGAVLNTTFAVVGRLTEGMATGTEGAFDAGPPAVRRIRVPDIRCFDQDAKSAVLAVLSEIRHADEMPPAPSRKGHVSTLRRRLDMAHLMGLGMTAGESSALLEQLYSSYGRWRSDVEDVERQMRQNRRQMSRSGQSRSVRPADSAGRRVWEEVQHLVRRFPSEIVPSEEVMEPASIPKGAAFPPSEPLIEQGVLQSKDGRVDLRSYSRVRYAEMLVKIGIMPPFEIPTNPATCDSVVREFEKDVNLLTREAHQRLKAYVGGEEVIQDALVVTRNQWFQECKRAAHAKREGQRQEVELLSSPVLVTPIAEKRNLT